MPKTLTAFSLNYYKILDRWFPSFGGVANGRGGLIQLLLYPDLMRLVLNKTFN